MVLSLEKLRTIHPIIIEAILLLAISHSSSAISRIDSVPLIWQIIVSVVTPSLSLVFIPPRWSSGGGGVLSGDAIGIANITPIKNSVDRGAAEAAAEKFFVSRRGGGRSDVFTKEVKTTQDILPYIN